MCTVECNQGYHIVAHVHMYLTKQVMLQANHSEALFSILVRMCRFVSKRAEAVARPRVNACANVMHVCRKSIARALCLACGTFVAEWGVGHESGAGWQDGSARTIARVACEPCVKRGKADRPPQSQLHIAHVVR